MIAAASTFKSAFALLEATPRRCACLSPVGQGQPVGSARFASYVRSSSGTLPPFSTSFCITCLCSQIFIDAEIVCVTAIAEFGSKLFARREAQVEIEKLHQIDNRLLPVELFLVVGRELGEDGGDIDSCRGRCARRGRRLRGCGWRRASGRCARRGRRLRGCGWRRASGRSARARGLRRPAPWRRSRGRRSSIRFFREYSWSSLTSFSRFGC